MKIKILAHNDLCKPIIIDKGDWIDLRSEEEVHIKAPTVIDDKIVFDKKKISLGISVKMPKGYEMIALPRSSTPDKYSILLCNSSGVIDNSYCGNDDKIMFNALGIDDAVINVGDRIAQFKVQLSQKATVIQKLKWLFSNKIKIEFVKQLNDENRGGFGSTGR